LLPNTKPDELLSNRVPQRRTALMPLVQVTMLEGRTADQKRKLAQRITDVMVEEAGARREAVVVAFHEVSKESYASGGVLMADKGK
jgi:4-oxalocrotonate tautomerase